MFGAGKKSSGKHSKPKKLEYKFKKLQSQDISGCHDNERLHVLTSPCLLPLCRDVCSKRDREREHPLDKRSCELVAAGLKPPFVPPGTLLGRARRVNPPSQEYCVPNHFSLCLHSASNVFESSVTRARSGVRRSCTDAITCSERERACNETLDVGQSS